MVETNKHSKSQKKATNMSFLRTVVNTLCVIHFILSFVAGFGVCIMLITCVPPQTLEIVSLKFLEILFLIFNWPLTVQLALVKRIPYRLTSPYRVGFALAYIAVGLVWAWTLTDVLYFYLYSE